MKSFFISFKIPLIGCISFNKTKYHICILNLLLLLLFKKDDKPVSMVYELVAKSLVN